MPKLLASKSLRWVGFDESEMDLYEDFYRVLGFRV